MNAPRTGWRAANCFTYRGLCGRERVISPDFHLAETNSPPRWQSDSDVPGGIRPAGLAT